SPRTDTLPNSTGPIPCEIWMPGTTHFPCGHRKNYFWRRTVAYTCGDLTADGSMALWRSELDVAGDRPFVRAHRDGSSFDRGDRGGGGDLRYRRSVGRIQQRA